jgi:glycerol-3-phosphate acyltransferase PlsX
MDDKPSQALRRGRKTSSMWLAIDAVKHGEADAAVSAGNTGALMAMARFILRMLPGIDRPAIAAVWPTVRGESIVLDVGATIGGDAQHLAIACGDGQRDGAGAVRSRAADGRPAQHRRRGGQGRRGSREAADLLRALNLPHIDFIGFVEGDGIGKGTCGRHRHRGLQRQYRAEGGRGHRRQIANICAAP